MRTPLPTPTSDVVEPGSGRSLVALRHGARQAWERRCTDDGGAVIVEAALMIPILVVIMAATFDFGVGFRNRISMQGATRNAARAAASLGPDVAADSFALTTLAAGLANGLTSTTLVKVIIFRTNSDGTLSNTCLTRTPSNGGAGDTTAGAQCNVYNQFQVDRAVANTFVQAGSSCSNTGWDYRFCPFTRSDSLVTNPDFLGVYLELSYTPMTKVFRSTFTLTDKIVVRIEPDAG